MFGFLLIGVLSYTELEPIEIPEGISNADACSICKKVIAGITEIMDNIKVQSAIAQLASELCKKFKNGPAQNLCNTIISEYLPKVISYISKGITKSNICSKLGLCKSNDISEELDIPEGLENGIACSICKHLITSISTIASPTAAQASKVCARFPKVGRNFCMKIVIQYLTKIISYLLRGHSASSICQKLKFCSTNSGDDIDDAYLQLYLDMDDGDFVNDVELPLGLSNADNCAICKKAVSFIRIGVSRPTSKALVIAMCISINAPKPS